VKVYARRRLLAALATAAEAGRCLLAALELGNFCEDAPGARELFDSTLLTQRRSLTRPRAARPRALRFAASVPEVWDDARLSPRAAAALLARA
jgi:hypothetical protein